LINPYPIVKGIVVTDLNDYICDGDNNLITRYSDELTRKLDRAVLTDYIQRAVDENCLFVVGENTWNQMGGKLRGIVGNSRVVTNKEEARHLQDVIKYTDKTSTKVQLANYVFEVAIRRKMNIVVLGGKSVYESFAGHYSELTHCRVKTDKVTDGKKISAKPDNLHNKEGHELLFSPYANWFSPINNETYEIIVYGD